jgi:hypothetical protein
VAGPGAGFWWQISAQPVFQGKLDTGTTIGLVRDVTPAHEFCNELAKQELHHNQAMNAGGQLSEALVANLRQQTSVIAGICDIMAMGSATSTDSSDCARGPFVDEMRAAVDELLLTAAVVRDYSCAMMGKLVFRPETQHSSDMMRFALSGIENSFRRSGIPLLVARPAIDCLVNVDPQRLRTVVNILLQLASRHASPGKAIELECLTPDPGSITLRITYEGFKQASLQARGNFDHDIYNPAIAAPFLTQFTRAHRARIKFGSNSKTSHHISLTIPVPSRDDDPAAAPVKNNDQSVANAMPASACGACRP